VPSADTSGVPDIVKNLAEAFSGQSKIGNRLWIGVIAVTSFIVLPAPPSSSGKSDRELPFGFGYVDSSDFDLIALLILAVLTIAFFVRHMRKE